MYRNLIQTTLRTIDGRHVLAVQAAVHRVENHSYIPVAAWRDVALFDNGLSGWVMTANRRAADALASALDHAETAAETIEVAARRFFDTVPD